MRDVAKQFLALAEKQGSVAPLMIAHRLMGMSLVQTGEIAQGRTHLDRAIALYDPAEHRSLGTRFGVDLRVDLFQQIVGSLAAGPSRHGFEGYGACIAGRA